MLYMSFMTRNHVFGSTVNPFNTSRTSGTFVKKEYEIASMVRIKQKYSLVVVFGDKDSLSNDQFG